MKFEEYPFDVTRLWDEPVAHDDEQPPQKLTKRAKPHPTFAAEVVQFPRAVLVAPEEASVCRKRTRAELRAIAMSLKTRDAGRRSWIADRCTACGRCPDMAG